MSLGLGGMKHGEVREYSIQRGKAAPATARVSYHSQQSYGDDNRPVRGAVTGAYTVEHEGRYRHFEHGPFAETEQAAKRGADRHSKHLTAYRVEDHIKGLA